MRKIENNIIAIFFVTIFISILLFLFQCAPPKTEPVRPGVIADEEYEPANWGKMYPLEYDSWLQSQEQRPSNKSKYKKGWDTDKVIYDKLSEYPYLALLYKGWGFGIEYNEPRGHYYMLTDVKNVDPSRTKAGGACLTCKSPYITKLIKENGSDFFKAQFNDAVNKIPVSHRDLGVACIDCHNNKDLNLQVTRWTIIEGLKRVEKLNPSRQEMRAIVCAQCHCTYYLPRDTEMKPTDVVLPWQNSRWGDISIENIIKQLQSDPANLEWTQSVTGFKVAFLRHPEFEFFSKDSVHWKAGAVCADCHMPYKRVGSNKISDHNVMSPLKNDMKACVQCHIESAGLLKEQVVTIQDRTISLLNRAGYATATTAKLFELTHKSQKDGRVIDESLYNQAKDFYFQALYRVMFIGAENSVGFHNPSEAGRILGDAIAFATKSEALLRQALQKAGIELPVTINLELSQYLNNRGEKKFNFVLDQEFKDPSGIQDVLLSESAKGL